MQQLQPTPETIPMQTDMSARELVDQIKTRMDSLNQQSKDLRKDMILAYTLRVWNELEYGNAESLFRAEFNSSLTAWWRQINTAIFEMVVVGGLPHELVAVIRDVANEIPSEHIGTIRRAIESVGVVSERGARELLEGGAKVSPEQWLYAYELTNGRLTSGTGQQAAQQIQIEQRTEQIARVYPKMAAMIQDGLPMEVAESVINIAAETDDERIHYILQVHGVSDPVVIPHLIRLAKRGKHGSGRESETLSTIVMTGAVSGDDDMPIGAISAVDLETHLQQASREHYFTAIEKSREQTIDAANTAAPITPAANEGAVSPVSVKFIRSLEDVVSNHSPLMCYVPSGEDPVDVARVFQNHGMKFLAVIAYQDGDEAPMIAMNERKQIPASRTHGRVPDFLAIAMKLAANPELLSKVNAVIDNDING